MESYHSTSPDGDQYYALSQELLRNGRFAYGPPPAPPAYSRLPGYPLFLAFVVDRALVPKAAHVLWAARANVVLDLATALLLFSILLACGLPRPAAWLGLAGVVVSPLQFLFSAYSLTESLATFLTLLALLLAVSARLRSPWLYATAAGLVTGYACLVRADAIVLLPALVLAVALHRDRVVWQRLAAGACVIAGVVVVMLPWGIRNYRAFGAPHWFGAEWSSYQGTPLPSGFMRWMRTWGTGAPGDGDLGVYLFYQRRDLSPRMITPRMAEDPPEREALKEIFNAYNREGLTEHVDDLFSQAAAVRRARHPVRYYALLPLRRIATLFSPTRHADYPLRVGFLGLPRFRRAFEVWNWMVYALALAGAILCWRRAGLARYLLVVFAAAVLFRSLLYGFAVPTFVSQRYLAEVFPLLIGLAAFAVVRGAGWIRAAIANRSGCR